MIFDAVPFRQDLSDTEVRDRALGSFTDFLEKKLGVKVVYDLRATRFGRLDLRGPLQLATLLKKGDVIKTFGPIRYFPDEPQLKAWYAICNDPTNHQAGGTTWESDESALYAALAEALERYIWFTQDDYFVNPTKATTDAISAFGPYIDPGKFVGFSEGQRAQHQQRQLLPDTEYLWIQGTSLVDGSLVYLPAQTVSGIRNGGRAWGGAKEPMIRPQITNGLATWPTQEGAWLAGALELIEREAYMCLWLNQLTLPRLSLDSLCALSPSLAAILAQCERYRFKAHVIQLPTDAPTHAIAVVMEDMSGHAPRFAVGLRAHQSLSSAVEKAMTEALRAHRAVRLWANEGNTWDVSTPVEKIGHRDRLYYWSVPENAKHLEFMIRGKEIEAKKKEWDDDTVEENLERVVAWCKNMNFDCISVAVGASAKNPTPLHIEMVVIPQLHPTYLDESLRQFGGTRWQDVPKKLGLTPLKKPFAERPHPFS